MLPVEQNDNQSEEINVIDEFQAEKRPVPPGPCPFRKLKEDGKKFPWSAVMFVVLSGRSRDNSRSPLTVPGR